MSTRHVRLARRGYVAEPLEPRHLLSASGDVFPAREYPGAATAAVAVGDVNGDGHPDLVTAGTGGTVLVRFGRGDGTFGPANAWPAGGTVTAVAIGDVTGDGKPDIVAGVGSTAATGRPFVEVLADLTGAGTFGRPVATAASTTTSRFTQAVVALTVADVNADGHPDVVVAVGVGGYMGSAVYVLSGSSGGTLAAPASGYSIDLYPESLAVADVNGDGKPDLVLGVGNPQYVGQPNDAAVLLNAGGGTFASTVLYPAGEGTAYAAVADVNGDGKPDIVVADGNGVSNLTFDSQVQDKPILSVLLNQGGGTFGTAASYGTYSGGVTDAQAVVLADVNGDGHPDAIVTSGSADTVGTLFNNATGGFGLPTFTAVGTAPGPLVAADLNGDGHVDVVAVNGITYDFGNAGPASVTPLLGRPDGTFGPPLYDASADLVSYTTTSDLTGDGRPDLVVANAPAAASLSVSANAGDGTFAAAAAYALGSAATGAAVAADLTADGHPDVVVPTAAGLSVLVNNGTGTFATPVTYAISGGATGPLALADVTGDGRPDLIAAGDGGVVVFANLGTGRFATTPTTYALSGGTPTALLTGDVDGDGRTDVAVLSGGQVTVLYGQSGGTLTAGTAYATAQTETGLALSDLNGDGRPDVVASGRNASTSNGVLTTLLYASGRAFTTVNYSTGQSTAAPSVQVADLNGDGHPDVFVGTAGLSFLNAGNGTLTAVTAGASVSAATLTALVDVTGDGVPDLVAAVQTRGVYNGLMQVYPGRGNGTFGPAQTYDVPLTPTSLTVADLNGDGKPDVVMNVRGGYGASPNSATTVLLDQRPATAPPPAVAAGGLLLVSPYSTDGSAVTLTTAGSTTTVTADSVSTPFANSAIAGGIRVTGADTTAGTTATLVVTGTPAVPLTYASQGGADSLTVTAGAATLAAGPAGGGINPLSLSAVVLAAGAGVRLATPTAATDHTVLSVATLADAGTLDLGGNDLIVTNGTLAAVSALAAAGFAGGAWTGSGLDSSAAAADASHLTALGVVQNVTAAGGSTPLFATFDGVAVTTSAVLVKYTDFGDANLSGTVDAADYLRVDAGFFAKLTGWANGDFNDDGVVDGSDYTLIDNAFDRQTVGAVQPSAVAAPAAAVAAVPTVAVVLPKPVVVRPVVSAAPPPPPASGETSLALTDARRDRRSLAGLVLDLLR